MLVNLREAANKNWGPSTLRLPSPLFQDENKNKHREIDLQPGPSLFILYILRPIVLRLS
jgi:hypothetical protein